MGKHVWNDTKAAHLLSCFERWSTNPKDKLAIDPNNLDKKYLTALQTSKEHSQYFGGSLSYETFRKHFKSWAAKFFTDQAAKGKRRKDIGKCTREEESDEEAEEEDKDSEEKAEEEEESDGEEELDDSNEMGKTSKKAPASTDDGVESARKKMSKMKVSKPASKVLSLEPYWYEDEDGDKILTVEQRLPEDTGNVEGLVLPSGQKLKITCFVSEDYLDTEEFKLDCPMQSRRAQLQVNARMKAVHKLKEENNQEKIINVFEIDLPFKCEERFCTKLDDDGFYINYKHNTTLVCILVGAEQAREKKKTPKKYGTKVFQEEEEEDEFGSMEEDIVSDGQRRANVVG